MFVCLGYEDVKDIIETAARSDPLFRRGNYRDRHIYLFTIYMLHFLSSNEDPFPFGGLNLY